MADNKFPHLNDTNFPNIDSVNPYAQYMNDVNYDSYNSTVKIKPCNVRWNRDSTDRVKWDSDTERDIFFDNLKGHTYDLETVINIVPETTVKVPVPYYAFQGCNYLMVETGILPNDTTPFDYGESGTLRYYFFIVGTHRIASNTTEIVLELDSWTTFINHAEISRIDLKRGHYPTTLHHVADYLKNPLENSVGLLDSEPVSLQNPNRVANSEFVPAMQGDLYMCFAVTCDFSQLKTLSKCEIQASSAPSYSDESGYPNFAIDGYVWGGLPIVSGTTTPLRTGQSADNISPTGYTIFAIECAKLYDGIGTDFFTYVNSNYPHFWNLINATYIVSDSCLQFGDSYTLPDTGYVLHEVMPHHDSVLSALDLKPEKFGYDSHYAMLAKLYTNPYARLQLSTDDGVNVDISIEDIAESLKICERVSLLYPYVNVNIFATNIGGSGVTALKWVDLNGVEHENTTLLPDSTYNQVLADYQIPTYTLFVSAQSVWNMNNRNIAVGQNRENAIRAYHNTDISAYTGLTNARGSADTAQTNTNDSAATAKNNTNRSSTNSINNTALTNSLNSTITSNANSASNTIYNSNVKQQNNLLLASNNKIDEMNTATLDLTTQLVDTEVASSAIGTVTAAIGTIGTAATGIAVTAATGGAAAPMVAAGLGAAGSIGLSSASFAAGASKTKSEAAYKQAYNDSAALVAKKYNGQASSASIAMMGTQNVESTKLNTNNTNASNNTNTSITANNAATANTNAQQTNEVAHRNSQRSRDIAYTNAQRSYDSTMYAARNNVSQAQQTYESQLADLKRQRPIAIASNTGNPLQDMRHTRGIQLRVLTQPVDIVRRIGDMFLRYGYTWHANVDNPVLNLKHNFTYWEGNPTIYGDIPFEAIQAIANLFENGVTVWKNPSNIGSSIYDNEVE